jgi:hypothetical protein
MNILKKSFGDLIMQKVFLTFGVMRAGREGGSVTHRNSKIIQRLHVIPLCRFATSPQKGATILIHLGDFHSFVFFNL